MEDWVRRALAKWPNVPALYDWLSLDRRGRWRIRGEPISRPQIIDTINRNYASDAAGRWFFQNGPQRGYVALEYAPLVLRAGAGAQSGLTTHTGLAVTDPRAAWLDEDGTLLLATEHGPGALDDQDLPWLLAHLRHGARPPEEQAIVSALALPSGARTPLHFELTPQRPALPLQRLDRAAAPQALGFVRAPAPEA